MKKLILVTNDDGIAAKGLAHLARLASAHADVVVVAPDRPQSGMSAAITVGNPLHVTAHPDIAPGIRAFSVSGTPVDCVKIALHTILPRTPDFVFSGVNHGSNSGTAITYSGTMGAVLEGCMAGVPSIGFSLLHHSLAADFDLSAPLTADIIATAVAQGLPHWTALNVNIPAQIVPKGIRACRACKGHWSEEYTRYLDPSGNPFYWLTGHFVNTEPEAHDTDEYFLSQGYISLVPVTPDQTLTSAIPAFAAAYDK